MESSLSSIHSAVAQVKEELFSSAGHDVNAYAFTSPCAYETAWLAMVCLADDDEKHNNRPMFKNCLTWLLNNQNEQGFWGEQDGENLPTIDTLPATLASMVALRKWNVGEENIRKGLDFIHSKAEMIIKMSYHSHELPRWFTIVFPGMMELAQGAGLNVDFPQGSSASLLCDIFSKRQQIIQTENLVDDRKYCSPLLSYLESLPTSYHVAEKDILKHMSEDGSIFQSPSATARAYMATGNLQCMRYLKSVNERYPHGAPAQHPMDEELMHVCMVDHVQRLGLAEYFGEAIERILKQVYRNHRNDDFHQPAATHNLPAKLFKDALVFRLLRMQGHDVKPSRFCWFLSDMDIVQYLERSPENLTSVLYAIYRATDIRFMGEHELDEARSFSRNLLEKSLPNPTADDIVISPGLHKVIKHELSLPWIARLDHLDHRMWIEENKTSPLWTGKASLYRLSYLHNEKLLELASKNYNFRQSIYAKELEELTRWSSKTGFTDIGFGREKSTYCYFAVSASSCLPLDSMVRLLIAKSAIIITVADDFYDMEGTLSELKLLTEAVQRWDGKNLSGHGKTIFNALDDLVTQIAAKYQHQHGRSFLRELRDLWKETFASWMVERTWSDSGYLPSMDEYLKTGMISIAAHTLILPAFFLLSPTSPYQKLKPAEYAKITKLVMTSSRLLNDTQSYQKEQIDGKMNFVLLHLKENPRSCMDDSIAYVKHILDEKMREFLELVLMDGNGGLDDRTVPKIMKQLHLSCMKTFQMFFNSTNLYDTKSELFDDIKQAIYVPLHSQQRSSDHRIKLPPLITTPTPETREIPKTSACFHLRIKARPAGLGIITARTSPTINIPNFGGQTLVRKFV